MMMSCRSPVYYTRRVALQLPCLWHLARYRDICGAFVTYYLPDGTIKVQLTTLKGEYRSDGTWTVDEDGIRCVTVDELRERRGYDHYDDQLYSGLYDGQLYWGRWATVQETNCYEVYFAGPIEYWFRVSGPHHLDSGESDIVQGRAFYL